MLESPSKMEPDEIRLAVQRYVEAGKRVFVSSSFQSHSIPLLHILSRLQQQIPVYFINTGFLFPETIEFRQRIQRELNLNVVDVRPNIPKIHQLNSQGQFFFASNTEQCCYLNKIQPMEAVLAEYDVWISGVRADQTATRAAMSVEAPGPFNVTRFHPMLGWDDAAISQYREEHQLPDHPLDKVGITNIGCEPCTMQVSGVEGQRSGRWAGQKKTECGLHLDLAKPGGVSS